MNAFPTMLFLMLLAASAHGEPHADCEQPLPVHLLQNNTASGDTDLASFLEVVEKRRSPDAGVFDPHGIWKSWLIVDRSRNYFFMISKHGVISHIRVHDDCFVTDKGVRVGDVLSKVLTLYPNAKAGESEYRLDHNEGGRTLTFSFDERVTEETVGNEWGVNAKENAKTEPVVDSITVSK